MAWTAEYKRKWRIENPEKDAAQREREKLRYQERIKSDPEFIRLVKAKRRRADSKKKAKLLNSPERAEKHQQFKLNQFEKSIMTQAELKALKRQHKLSANAKFEATYGIKYNTYWRWSKKCGLTNIQDVIEYRNNEIAKIEANKQKTEERKKLISAVRKKNDAFMAEHGVSYTAYRYFVRKYGGSIEDYKAFKAKNEADLVRQKELDKEIQVSNTREKIVSVNPKPIKVSKPKIKLSQNQIRESAWQTMQNKISHLNCVISIESIRDTKINELQQNFYQQYGAM